MKTVFDEVAGVSLITPDRLENLRRAAWETEHLQEDMAELGVYRGGSALVLARLFPDRMFHLFDTFTGLPFTETPERNPTGHDLNEGRFACSFAEAAHFLMGRRSSKNLVFHTGVFPETTKGLDKLLFSFVHIDCDLYASAKAGIEWFWPRLVDDGIIYFDDYGCDFTGVTDAVHEAFKDEQINKQYEHNIQIGCFVKK